MPEPLLLLADDDPAQRRVLAGFLRKHGYEVAEASSTAEAVDAVASRPVDAVVTDLRMPGGGGMGVLQGVHEVNPEIPVLLVTAFGTVEAAVEAMKAGAADFIAKPLDLEQLEVRLARSLERRRLVSENRALREQLRERHRLEGLETSSTRMAEAIDVAARAAISRATVLIRGESGTGKELLARAIHHASPRTDGPWVAVNLAAVPETLIEADLFGHEKGAFTGADRERRGRLERAHGGTLFLDEVGDLPPGTQVKLLRVLQERTVERLGGSRPISVDVRVLAATSRNLEKLMAEGRFREDLYYRLAVVSIALPPLRERKEDLPLLTETLLRRFAREAGAPARSLSREAMDALLRYAFPGNVRELENILHRAVVLSRGPLVTTADLPLHLGELAPEAAPADGSLVQRLAAYERALLVGALEAEGGVQTRAARRLGMSERHLRYRLRKHGLAGGGDSPPSD